MKECRNSGNCLCAIVARKASAPVGIKLACDNYVTVGIMGGVDVNVAIPEFVGVGGGGGLIVGSIISSGTSRVIDVGSGGGA